MRNKVWVIKEFLIKFFKPIAKEIIRDLVKNDFNLEKTKLEFKDDLKEFVLDQLSEYLRFESEDWFFGAILNNDVVSSDYIAWAENWFDLSGISENPYKTVTEFDQKEFADLGPSNCTLYAVEWMGADNAWVITTQKERKLRVKYRQINYFFTPKWGYLRDWNIAYREWINKNTDFEVSYFTFKKTDELFESLLNKGYRLNFWYRGTSNFRKDARDGVLDDPKRAMSWKAIYGHSTTLKKIGDDYVLVDSYKGRSYNKIKISDLSAFKGSDFFFQTIHFVVSSQLVKLELDKWEKRVKDFLAKINPEAQKNNRFLKVLCDKVRNWYDPIYNDYNDIGNLNAAEVKTLDDINNSRNG